MMKSFFTFYCLLVGACLQGLSMSLFLFPHSIPSGGAAGLAILLNHWFDLSHGLSLWLANIVFLLFALRYFGFSWTIRTIFSVAVTSVTVTLLTEQVSLPHVHIGFDIIVGSLIFGIGVGLLIRAGASSGGIVIPALMIASYKKWSPGKVMMIINMVIFLLTAMVIDYTIVIFALICQFISTNIIDFIYALKFNKFTFLSANGRKRS